MKGQSNMRTTFLAILLSSLALQAQITLVKDRKPVADIVAAEGAQKPIGALNAYLKKSTGTTLPFIKTESQRAKLTFKTDSTLDREEFKVDFPDATTIAITAGSEDGLAVAVWDFLERHLGIRWLFPGELGEVVPKHDTLSIPTTPYGDKPDFLSRQFAARGNAQVQWRNKLHACRLRVGFHHNLLNLYAPEEFADAHPEFYPIMSDGKRFDPKTSKKRWQPCFTAPGIAEAGAEKIIKILDNNPKKHSYSLGVNDTNNHCRCPACLAIVGEKRNFRGLYHYSPVYIPFANKIAGLVCEKHPDCKIGFLAYSCILEPVDGLKLHENLVPFMTLDRHKWIDKEQEAYGHALTERWRALSNHLGWYDYIYGGAYALPRVYFHHCADYLRWGYAHGVRHIFAEYYPREDWHEGPKFYLYMKLLWNVNTDVDATLDEWYNLAVGPKAAPYLKEYYARLEDFWTHRVQNTEWFRRGGQYLKMKSDDYLEAYTFQELEKSEELMTKVLELSDNKPRAQMFMDAFQTSKKAIASKLTRIEKLKTIQNREFPLVRTSTYDDRAEAAKLHHWQYDHANGKFFYDEKGGRNGTGALGIDGEGSHGTSMCYLEYWNVEVPSNVRASVWFKAEGLEETDSVNLSIKWLVKDSEGVHAEKPGWLPESYSVSKAIKNPKQGEWIQLRLANITPDEVPCKMTVHLSFTSAHGKVLFDDFQIFAEKQ